MFLMVIALSAIVINGEGQTIAASSASSTVAEPNSDFMLKLLLENPSSVGGSYLIVQEDTLLKAIKDSFPSGFYYGKGKVRYDTIRTKTDLSGPVGNTMLLTDIIEKGIEISQGEIPIGPLTPLELYGYYTGKPTNPPEIAASIGETMIDNKRKSDAALFDYRMRNYGFYRDPAGISTSAALTPWKIHDGIPIPPSTTLVLEIPIRAPADEDEYNINLEIPYLYTTKQIPDVSTWDGGHIAQGKVSLKVPITVKNQDQSTSSISTKYYSGVATRSSDHVAWPFKLTLIGPDNDGSISGQIEWTTLNAIHQIEGSKTSTGLTFTETAYIKKGNAILDCRYDLKPDGNSFKGVWGGCGGGHGGDISMNPS